jgi:hypothetical protein
MRRVGLLAALAATWMALVPGLVSPVVAQDEAAPDPAPAEAVPDAPKRKIRPKPRPKPQAKPAPAETAPAKAADTPPAEPAASPIPSAVPSPTGMNFAAPPVACDPGQAVRYQGDKNLELWVTRSGRITIDNPLRPLTPDVTRVLQVVVAGKVATAYGPDLLSLRRGASPATLEGTIGGRIQWDASIVALPDSQPINAETGKPLAELRFLECGTAPSGKLLPPPKARRMAPTPEAVAAEAEKAEKAAKAAALAAAKAASVGRAVQPPTGGAPQNLTPPRMPGSALPQGAIP